MRFPRLVAAACVHPGAGAGAGGDLSRSAGPLGGLPPVRVADRCRNQLPALAFSPHEDGGAHHWPSTRYRRSEEHTSELQSLMRISYAVFCLKKKKQRTDNTMKQYTKRTVSDDTKH